jgi:GNAT superfamily N-acetyltransferase
LLNEPNCLSYRLVTPDANIVGFIFIMTSEDGAGHITTIGVAPEHRRRGLAQQLLDHAETLCARAVSAPFASKFASATKGAKPLRQRGYAVVQRLEIITTTANRLSNG